MDKKNIVKRANRILEIAQRMAEKQGWQVRNHIEEITLHYNGYAESGYTDPECGLIATGNWNDVTSYKDGKHEIVSNLPSRVGDLFEKMGLECEWSDEWSTCHECGKLVRTQPDSYSWKQSFHYVEAEGCLCVDCVEKDPESFLYSLEGNCETASTLDINPKQYGYVRVNAESYETGYYFRQDKHPAGIAKDLEEKGITRYLFTIDNNEQFCTHWSVFVHESEAELLEEDDDCDEDESE